MEFYFYDGPVMQFGRTIDPSWYGETYAVSAKKALSNLAYQFKKKLGYGPKSKFELDINYLKKG